MSGLTSYHAGLAAESSVADHYERTGHKIERRRWKTRSGEIDLIVRSDKDVIFVEVKKSKSFEKAALVLSQKQISRLFASASQFLAGEENGQDSNSRFDVALVNGIGEIQIIENALCA